MVQLILFAAFYLAISLLLFICVVKYLKQHGDKLEVKATIFVCLFWAPLFFLLFIKKDKLADKMVGHFRVIPLEDEQEKAITRRLEERGF